MFQCIRTSFIHYATTLYDSSEAVIWSSSVKKVFLKISQNSQENNFARVSFLIKLQAFLTEHLRWLLLSLVVLTSITEDLFSYKTNKPKSNNEMFAISFFFCSSSALIFFRFQLLIEMRRNVCFGYFF